MRSGGQRPSSVSDRDARDLDDVVGNEAVAAADELEAELALADAGVAGDQDAEAEHVHEDAVPRRHLRQAPGEIAAQLVDEQRGRERRGEERDSARFGDLCEPRVAGHAVGEEHRGGGALQPELDQALEPRALERGEVRLLVASDDLDAVRVDEVEVADERGRLGGVGADDCAAALLAAYPGELELLRRILIQPRDAGLQHTAATRRRAGGGRRRRRRSRGSGAAPGR